MAIIFAAALIYFSVILQCTKGQFQNVIQYDLPQNQAREAVGDLCAKQMELFITALSNLELWAITMIDASSKLPASILTGNINDLGNFDECVKLEHQEGNVTIKGKHCRAGLSISLAALLQSANLQIPGADQISDITLSLSLCIPDGCKPTEVASYLEIDGAAFSDRQCQTNEPLFPFDGGDIAAATFLALILFLMIASTIYDVYLYKTNKKPFHLIFLAFSIFTNGKKIVAVNTDDKKQLTCLHGLRCISMLWVVAGHRFVLYARVPVMNKVDTLEWPTYLYSQYIQAAPIAVDTFFYLSGMMISYGYFKEKVRPKSISFIPLYYLHRYLRITPAVAALYFVSNTIWKHVSSGPLQGGQQGRNACFEWWWTYFLYIQNYVNYNNICIITTWYLSADMQMFLLSPFIFLPLGYIMVKTSMKTVYSCCTGLVLLFMAIQLAVKLNVDSRNAFMTHERLSVWMIGFTAGILLQEIKSKNTKIKMNSILNLLIWVIILTGMIAILITMHDVNYNRKKLKSTMFSTFHRPAWGLGLTWIVYSCTIGYGGFVNWFLSLPFFQVLSRLTYCMYLVHIFVISFSIGRTRTVSYFSDFSIFYDFCGDIICTTISALVWVLAFESPMIIIEKCIFAGNTGPKRDNLKNSESTALPHPKAFPVV